MSDDDGVICWVCGRKVAALEQHVGSGRCQAWAAQRDLENRGYVRLKKTKGPFLRKLGIEVVVAMTGMGSLEDPHCNDYGLYTQQWVQGWVIGAAVATRALDGVILSRKEYLCELLTVAPTERDARIALLVRLARVHSIIHDAMARGDATSASAITRFCNATLRNIWSLYDRGDLAAFEGEIQRWEALGALAGN